jgi:hypothetical protein
MLSIRVAGALSVLSLSVTPTLALAQTQRARLATLESGTVIPVKLQRELSSKNNQRGDTFTAVVKADADGYSGLPEGTIIEGTIREAKRKEGSNPGTLDLAFRRIRLSNGRAYDIEGSVIGLDNKSVDRKSDGRLVAKPASKNNRLVYAGYGAGAGLLVGLLANRKLKLENVLIGGALGYLAGSLEKGKQEPRDVTLKSGTEVGVRLDRSVTVSTASLRNNAGDTAERDRDRISDRERDNGSGRLDRRRGDQATDANASGAHSNRDTGEDRERTLTPDNASDGIGVLVDDQDVRFTSNATPFMAKGVALIPVRAVATALNASVKFDEARQRLVVKRGETSTSIGIGSKIAVLNGSRRIVLEAVARRLNGDYYVPAKFFELVSGNRTQWDSSSRTVTITTGNDR